MSTSDDVGDICNLGSLTCTLALPENSIQNNSLCLKSNNGYNEDDDDDDMCLIDNENFLTYDGETSPTRDNNTDAKKVSLCVIILSHLYFRFFSESTIYKLFYAEL